MDKLERKKDIYIVLAMIILVGLVAFGFILGELVMETIAWVGFIPMGIGMAVSTIFIVKSPCYCVRCGTWYEDGHSETVCLCNLKKKMTQLEC